MKDGFTFQQKVKVLNKLFDAKILTEKDLSTLSLESILALPSMTIQDMKIIVELQKQVKSNKLFTFLGSSKEVISNG